MMPPAPGSDPALGSLTRHLLVAQCRHAAASMPPAMGRVLHWCVTRAYDGFRADRGGPRGAIYHLLFGGRCKPFDLSIDQGRWPARGFIGRDLRLVGLRPLRPGESGRRDGFGPDRPRVIRRLRVGTRSGLLLRYRAQPLTTVHSGHFAVVWNQASAGYAVSGHPSEPGTRRQERRASQALQAMALAMQAPETTPLETTRPRAANTDAPAQRRAGCLVSGDHRFRGAPVHSACSRRRLPPCGGCDGAGLARARVKREVMMTMPAELDFAGRRRSPALCPDITVPPRNKGRRYPDDPARPALALKAVVVAVGGVPAPRRIAGGQTHRLPIWPRLPNQPGGISHRQAGEHLVGEGRFPQAHASNQPPASHQQATVIERVPVASVERERSQVATPYLQPRDCLRYEREPTAICLAPTPVDRAQARRRASRARPAPESALNPDPDPAAHVAQPSAIIKSPFTDYPCNRQLVGERHPVMQRLARPELIADSRAEQALLPHRHGGATTQRPGETTSKS